LILAKGYLSGRIRPRVGVQGNGVPLMGAGAKPQY
jgi:hypothetical protein